MENIFSKTISQIHADLKNNVYTVSDVVSSFLNNAKTKNGDINAYLEFFDVDSQIKNAESMFANNTATLLTGVPISIKDNMLYAGHHATAGSKILDDYVAPYSATVVSVLVNAGAIILGRTNMDEFAMGSSTETSAYGKTKNPLNTEYVPGGSSGGAVSSVAMNGAVGALGSDTGGSIRQPAAYTGLVGFKPTYGAVSRYGIISMASSFDQVGPIAKTVEDARIIFDCIKTYDNLDATSIPSELRKSTKNSIKKIGVPREWVMGKGIDESVQKNFLESIEKIKSAGFEIIDIDLPLTQHSLAVYYVINPAEISSNLARYDGIRYGQSAKGENLLDVYNKTRGQFFGSEVRRRILLGTYILSHGYYDAYYGNALKVQKAITNELENIFENVDAILTPTAPTLPFKFGQNSNDPMAMKLSDLFLAPANVAGLPAISMPSGDAGDNLKHSIHFLGSRFSDEMLFDLAQTLEKSLQ
jgi:aspartyl-tRNA(Asn)/glutamyl-tRNA(Gln) amidotransferase subunit A